MQHYTVGFVLSPDRQRVLLLEKQKPIQHRGLYNGIGGKINQLEMPLQCIHRECREETGLILRKWHLIERSLADDGGDLYIYAALCPNKQTLSPGDAGLAQWFECNQLPQNIVPDVIRLVGLTQINQPCDH